MDKQSMPKCEVVTTDATETVAQNLARMRGAAWRKAKRAERKDPGPFRNAIRGLDKLVRT